MYGALIRSENLLFYSQWGLIPKNPLAGSRGSFRARRFIRKIRLNTQEPALRDGDDHKKTEVLKEPHLFSFWIKAKAVPAP
jgi:hypothetical protein